MPKGVSKAVIWDMDGVIADTAPYHFAAWRYVFRKRGVNFTEADFKRRFGQRNDTIISAALGGNATPGVIGEIADEKEAEYCRRVRRNVKPLPGVLKLIEALKSSGFSLALASSAPAENIRLVTGELGVDSCFHAVVSGREVAEGKPSPQVFLLAAGKLGVSPECCLVIEDAVAGVAAAERAGMKCLAVTNTHPGAKLAEADLVVDTLEKVSVSDIDKLIGI